MLKMHEEEENALLNAIKCGNLTTAANLIAEVNNIFENGRLVTALSAAGNDANFQMVCLLMENGADVEFTDDQGQSFLAYGKIYMAHDLLVYLLNVGARVNRRHILGWTVLHLLRDFRPGFKESFNLLCQNGAIMRNNENGDLPIILAKRRLDMQSVDTLDEMAVTDGEIPIAARHSHQSRCTYCTSKSLADMYKLYGASFSNKQKCQTIETWSRALKLCELANESPTYHGKPSYSSCTYCTRNNTQEVECCKSEPWTSIGVLNREVVTGIELLQRETKGDAPMWMKDFRPNFNIPACPPGCSIPTLVYQSVNEVRRHSLLDKLYQEKCKQIQTELYSLYSSEKQLHLCQRSSRIDHVTSSIYGQSTVSVNHGSTACNLGGNGVFIKPTAKFDAILGIEPTGFLQKEHHEKDIDPRSYYLQRYRLASHCHYPPRTSYRCSYRCCTVCGLVVIQFGGVCNLQSPGFLSTMSNNSTTLVCQGCSFDYHQNSNQPVEDYKQSLNSVGFHSYRHSVLPTANAVGREMNMRNNHQATPVKICPYCGLVSEKHPMLQAVQHARQEAFGDICEFSSMDEVEECRNNPTALRLQKSLIKMRLQARDYPFNIMWSGVEMFWRTVIPESFWRYTMQLLKIFFKFDLTLSCHFAQIFVSSLYSEVTKKKRIEVNPALIIDYLELAIDCFESIEEKKSVVTADILFDQVSEYSFNLTTLLLWCFLPEVPFRKTSLKGLCLIDSVTKEYIQRLRYEDGYLNHCQLFKTLRQKKNNSGATVIKTETLSSTLIHRFISQVYRLVCLDQKQDNGSRLLHVACSFKSHAHTSICVEFGTLAVSLLLRLGANPNCVDSDGQTVVGIVLKNIEEQGALGLLSALKEAGAHLDAYKRQDACDELNARLLAFFDHHGIFPVQNAKLVCLTAAAMRINNLSSTNLKVKTCLPDHLLTFISLH